MPFATDTEWPQGLLRIFNASRNAGRKQDLKHESRYYGPYDRLFNYAIVEGAFNLFLAPQTIADEESPNDVADSLVFLVVFDDQQKPVLIVEIKDDAWVDLPLKRQKADAQIRHRFEQMLLDCPIPRLYGLSLLGTSLRVYCTEKDTGTITPLFVDRPDVDRTLPRDFLEGQWDIDILSQEGFNKMQEIVAYIKAEVDKVRVK